MGSLVHTGLITTPQIKITEDLGVAPLVSTQGSPEFYRKKFKFESIDLFDAFDQASYLQEDKPVELEDLTAIRYVAPEFKDNQKTIVLPTRASRSFVEGPTPSGTSGAQGGCAVATDEEIYATLQNKDGSEEVVIACIEQGALPVESAEQCEANEKLLTTADGRLYCVPNDTALKAADGTNRVMATEPTAVAQASQLRQSTESAFLAALEQPSWRKPVMAEAKREEVVIAKEVILVGFGQAYDIGNGTYLTSNPNGPGFLMLEAADVKPAKPEQRKAEIMRVTCKLNAHMAGCGRFGGSPISRVAKFSFPNEGVVEASLFKNQFLDITLRAAFAIEAKAAGGATWIKPLRIETRISGVVTITPTIGLGITGGLSAEAAVKNRQDANKSFVEIDFAKKALPAGAVFKGTLKLEIGIEVGVSGNITADLSLPVTTRFDGGISAGWGCRRSWFRDCVSGSDVGFKVVPSIFYQLKIPGPSISGTAEPYLQVSINTGLRGVDADVVKVAARAFVQGELKVEGPTIQISNVPEDLERVGKKLCIDGQGGASITLYAGSCVFVEVTTKGTPIEKIFKYYVKTTIYEKKYHIASYGWDFAFNSSKPFPKKEGIGLNIKPVEDSPPCSPTGTPPTPPESRDFKAGEFTLEAGKYIVTKNRKFSMQEDGNFVIYDYDPSKPKEEGRVRFATGTNSGLNYRIVFQRDGNLVIYSLRDRAIWASNTSGLADAKLSLQPDGNFVIYRDNNSVAFSANSQN